MGGGVAEKTGIQWTDSTWNPIRGNNGFWSCVKVSEGCKFCYAERMNTRRGGPDYAVGADTLRLDEATLTQPLRWKKPRRIFVCSMTDLFEERVKDENINRIFRVMWRASGHTFQVLTKRAERLCGWANGENDLKRELGFEGVIGLEWPLPNVWLGVSVENQARADERIPWLLKTPAAVRFLSVEPLLGPVDLGCWLPGMPPYPGQRGVLGREIDWVIVGGESGGPPDRALVSGPWRWANPGGRPNPQRWGPKMEAVAWVRALRDQCVAAGVPYFFKQWGGPTPKSGGRLLDGKEWSQFPS